LLTEVGSKMKINLLNLADSARIQGRALVESDIDVLKTVCNVEHRRHVSPIHAFTHRY
jgi:hypothetical protein